MYISTRQLLLTAKIGDGCIYKDKNCKTYRPSYSSVNKEYLLFKQKVFRLEGYGTSNVKTRVRNSGYNTDGVINELYIYVNKEFKDYYYMSKEEAICKLDHFGFLMYYLDDGSLNSSNNTMRIHCCDLTESEITILVDKIYELFPVKKCSIHWQTKDCGKKYPYLYVPRKTAIEIVNYYEEFMKNEPLLSCMTYKFGLPSQTIESNKCNSLIGE